MAYTSRWHMSRFREVSGDEEGEAGGHDEAVGKMRHGTTAMQDAVIFSAILRPPMTGGTSGAL